MKNNKISDDNSSHNNDEFNSINAVEQVYPAEIMDSAQHINNLFIPSLDAPLDTQQKAANDPFAYADIYSLDSARLAQHNRSLERRANKGRLTDRRSTARLRADGEVQEDRRADNRIVNAASIRSSNLSSPVEPHDAS